jgi:hypothetical protein
MPAIMKIRVASGRCEHVIHKLSIGINLPLFGGPVARGQRGTMTITTPSVMGAADLIMLKKSLVTHARLLRMGVSRDHHFPGPLPHFNNQDRAPWQYAPYTSFAEARPVVNAKRFFIG